VPAPELDRCRESCVGPLSSDEMAAMARRLALLVLVCVLGASLVATDFGALVTGDAVVEAQQNKKKRPGVFERLFGPREREQPPKAVRPRSSGPSNAAPSKRRVTPARKSAPSGGSAKPRQATTVPEVKVGEKDPNARKILVVGDFVGSGIAWGLDQALAREPRIAVIESTKDKSGLIRTDVYDWNSALLGILNEQTPDVIVVALGVNDREELRIGDAREAVRSEPWKAAYEQRIDAMTDTLKVYGRPFFWVSAPPLRGDEATADIAYFNGLIEPRVAKAGGHFVDVWNGFTNASGQFITTGPDTEGQVKALRTSDGVNFTSVGKQKLAYYVERDIRRHTGIGAGIVDLVASVSQTSTIEIGPDGKKRLVGPVLSLSTPVPGSTPMLAGAPAPVVFDPISGKVVDTPATETSDSPEAATETVQYRLVVRGEALPTVAGRVDDFAWPPSQRGNQAFLAPLAAIDAAVDGEGADDAEPVAAN
jgi:hypothetical protein